MRKSLGQGKPLCHPDIVPVLLYLKEQELPVVLSDIRSVISNYDTVKKRIEYLESVGLVETKTVKSKNTSVMVWMTEKGKIVAQHLDAAERTIAGEAHVMAETTDFSKSATGGADRPR